MLPAVIKLAYANMNIIDRLESLLDDHEITDPRKRLSYLAKAANTTYNAVYGWYQKPDTIEIKAENLENLSNYFGVSMDWLKKGKGPKTPFQVNELASFYLAGGHPDGVHVPKAGTISNVHPAPPTRNVVPLISWVKAGEFAEAIDIYQPGGGDELIEVSVRTGPHTYALRVRGESMYDPAGGQHSFAEGDIIIVDPDRERVHRSYVIAKLANDNEVTFKQLIHGDGGKMLLKALNPRWPQPYIEMTPDCQLIGVVVEKVQRTTFI
jgi:SOS-response transcriptional repressor LexA